VGTPPAVPCVGTLCWVVIGRLLVVPRDLREIHARKRA